MSDAPDELELLRQIGEVLPDAFWITDIAVSKTFFISRGFEELWHMPRQAQYDNSLAWLEAVHPDDRERIRAHLGENRPGEYEYRIVRTDGSVRWIQARAFPLHGKTGTEDRLVGVAVDVTAQKQAEIALRDALEREAEARANAEELAQLKDQLLTRVSHQVRTRLTSILGYAKTLQRPEVQEEQSAEFLRRLAANAEQLQRMIADMLDIDRANRHTMTAHRATTDIKNLVQDVADSVELGRQRRADVQVEPILCRVDRALVERMLEALFTNAIEHTPEGTRVWVDGHAEGHELVLRVSDEGPGVGPRQRVFEPFSGEFSSRSHDPGLGLGLSLVEHFADLHGGSVTVRGRQGGGALFEVRLPHAVVGTSEEPPAPRVPTSAIERPVVLAIDDDEQFRLLLRRMLGSAGVSCLLAESGLEGIILAREYRPDLILLDIAMPNLSGTAVLRRLRADPRTDQIPVMMVTAVRSQEAKTEHLLLGAYDYLTKPFTTSELIGRLEAKLEEASRDLSGGAS